MQLSIDDYINCIMYKNYDVVKDISKNIVKFYNEEFVIITQKKNCVLVIDNRFNPPFVYHDIKTAYRNIISSRS